VFDYFVDLALGENFSDSKLTSTVVQSNNVESQLAQTIYFHDVRGERFVYDSGTSVYEFDYAPLGYVAKEELVYFDGQTDYTLTFPEAVQSSATITAVVDGKRDTLTAGSSNDYEFVDTDSDGNIDTLRLTGNTLPDPQTTIELTYDTSAWSVDSVTDSSGTTYTVGTDVGVVDSDGDGYNDALDWSIGGSTPTDGTEFTVDYRPARAVDRDLVIDQRSRVSAEETEVTIESY